MSFWWKRAKEFASPTTTTANEEKDTPAEDEKSQPDTQPPITDKEEEQQPTDGEEEVEQRQQGPTEEEEEEEEEEPQQTQVPGIPSRRGPARSRSLSRVFNHVPPVRPRLAEGFQDLFEYYCHLACLQTNPRLVLQEKEHAQQALKVLVEHCNHGSFPRYGRLYTRLQLACLSVMMGRMEVDDEDGEDLGNSRGQRQEEDDPEVLSVENGPHGLEPAHQVKAINWDGFIHQLNKVRMHCLRKDANFMVSVSSNQTTTVVPNEELDTKLQEHVMFQQDYKEVTLLLMVQRIAAAFRQELHKLVEQKSRDKTFATQEAVSEYKSRLTSLFASHNQITTDLTGVKVPKSLTHFLSLSSGKQPGPLELHNACLKVSQGGSTTYSFSTVQQKTRDLILKWSEKILPIPTLVTLGYGGVRAPIVTIDDEAHDDDDVSSYGVDEEFVKLDTSQTTSKRRGPKTSATSEEIFGPSGSGAAEVGPSQPLVQSEKPASEDEEMEDAEGAADSIEQKASAPVAAAVQLKKERRNLVAEHRQPEKRPRRRASLEFMQRKQQEQVMRTKKRPPQVMDDNGSGSDSSAGLHSFARKTKQERQHDQMQVQSNHPTDSQHSDGDGDDNVSGSSSSAGLHALARKSKRQRQQAQAQAHPPTNSQEAALWDSDNKDEGEEATSKQTRIWWTEEECDAVRDGYRQFGRQWRMIKDNCDNKLHRRTNVQIKDKFRTMLNRGEIEPNESSEED